jgi:hypothetical protein
LPVTDGQKIRQLISEHPEGLSRKQISEKLSLSSSKVGELVKDIISSDDKYYEWREGRTRLIRYRDDL